MLSGSGHGVTDGNVQVRQAAGNYPAALAGAGLDVQHGVKRKVAAAGQAPSGLAALPKAAKVQQPVPQDEEMEQSEEPSNEPGLTLLLTLRSLLGVVKFR